MLKINFTILENGIIKANDGKILAYFDRSARMLHVSCASRIFECDSDELAGDILAICLEACGEAA